MTDDQRMQEIAEQVVEVSMRRLGKIPGLIGGHIFTAEADRLTAPAEDSSPEAKFEGVKYVVHAEKPSEPIRLATREEWIAYHQRDPSAANVIFLQWPGEERINSSQRPDLYTPWHPKKGDRVWLDGKPQSVRTVRFASADGVTYNLAREDGGTDWGASLANLRPYQFGPKHTKPEAEREGGKAEFEEGELVVDDCNYIRVARVCGGSNSYHFFDGGHAEIGENPRPATDDDIMGYLRTWPPGGATISGILRDHFRSEAQKENQDD